MNDSLSVRMRGNGSPASFGIRGKKIANGGGLRLD